MSVHFPSSSGPQSVEMKNNSKKSLISVHIYDPVRNELAIHQLLWIRQSVSANKPFTALRIRSMSVHFPSSSGPQRVEVKNNSKKF